jgi:hypothetical protein
LKTKSKILICLLFVPILLYLNSSFLSNKIALYSKNYPLLYTANNYFYKFMDAFNPFVSELNLASKDVTNIDIKINKKDFNTLHKTLENSYSDLSYLNLPFMSSYNNPWIDAKLRINSQNYNGKLKFHGNNVAHFLRAKKSLKIKLAKDNLYNNMRKFSLIVMNEASIPLMFSYKVQEIFLGYKVETGIVKVSINGINQGTYFLEETASKESLEKNGLVGYDILKPFDEKDHQYNTQHMFPFMWEIAYTHFKNFSKRNIGQLATYEKLHQSNNSKAFKAKLDLQNLSTTEAMRALFNHPIYGDNDSLLYNTSTGRFSRYFRTENNLKPILKVNGRVSLDPILYSMDHIYRNEIFINLIQDDDFRFMRNKQLWRILSKKEALLELYKNMLETYKGLILSDPTHHNSGKTIVYQDTEKLDVLIANFKAISEYLERTEYTIKTAIKDKEKIIIFENNSNVPLRLKGRGVDLIIAAKIDSQLMPIKNIIKFYYRDSTDDLEITNMVTGKKFFYEI